MALVLFHLPTLVLNHTATLLYPLYASYKAVTAQSRRTSSVSSYNWSVRGPDVPPPSIDTADDAGNGTELAEMEHWLIYWSVFACLALAEGTFGWTWRWLPFYWEIRLLFNLWLVLPQTRGATWLYVNHLHPFLQGQEDNIDRIVDDAKARIRTETRGLLGKVLGGVFAAQDDARPSGAAPPPQQQQQQQQHAPASAGGIWGGAPPSHAPPGNAGSAPPPTHLGSLFGKLAPYAAAGAASWLAKANASASSGQQRSHSTRAAALQTDLDLQNRALSDLRDAEGIAAEPQRTLRRAQALARKRQLEQQLAHLNGLDGGGGGDSTTESGESDDLGPPKAGGGPNAAAAAAVAGIRKRYPSVLGESYDFLEGSDTNAGASGSPRVEGERKASSQEKWAGWIGRNLS
ncbi:uncharacterized protein PSFLO_07145 [Pseudozyma flocculosa]|uniref:Protein YOP1 n=1 Tax=Pseudozyma flocculosa TaxID=84751 RepID=A0A5C3FB42_9BASI|nr:uncharacterized protein PSFLO_07145 [Pseudozyma flocculosa]